MLAASTMWGLSSVLMKMVLPGVPPFGIAFMRVVLSSVVLSTAALLRSRNRRHGDAPIRKSKDGLHLAVLTITTVAVPFCLTAWAQQDIDASLSAVLHATIPLWTAGFATVLLGFRPPLRQLLAVAAGLVGVAVLAGIGSADLTATSWHGCVAVLTASACYGFGWTYLRRNLSHLKPLYIAALIQAGALLVLLPLAAATTDITRLALTPERIGCLLALGVISTAGAELMNYRNIARLGPTTAALTAYLVPIVGVAAGVSILGEQLSARLVIGTAIILGSVGLAVRRKNGRSHTPNSRPAQADPVLATGTDTSLSDRHPGTAPERTADETVATAGRP
ncbi:DMT family transporter [Nocardia sp. NPDC020380]|uniref:DMT family transporter n=1 Tax=Nocardia sp. NPDC020380 TaxID=3364309 RepID=UPI00379EDDC9